MQTKGRKASEASLRKGAKRVVLRFSELALCLFLNQGNKKGGSKEPPFIIISKKSYSAKTTTLFFITSTVPPFTSNFISFPA